MDDIHKMVDFAEAHLRNVGSLVPMMEIVCADGKLELAALTFRNDAEKDQMAAAMKARCKEVGAKEYTFLTEAWVTSRTVEEGITERPSEAFDRVEVVMVEKTTWHRSAIQPHLFKIRTSPPSKWWRRHVHTSESRMSIKAGIGMVLIVAD